jgi:type II secretory pathway pseudopilin PulG
MKAKSMGFKGGFARQAGFTLLESIIVALVFIAIVAGALAGKSVWDTRSDINAVASTVQTVAETARSTYGGAGYGTTTMDFTLSTNRAFSNPRYKVAVAAGVATVTNQNNAAVTVTGTTNNFTYSESGLSDAVCAGFTPRLTATMWTTVKIGAAAARSVPISATQAATDCAALAGGAIVLTAIS